MSHDRFDTTVTEAEMRAAWTSGESWIAVDRDQDGRVTRGEFTALNYAEAPREIKAPAARAPDESASGGATRAAPIGAPTGNNVTVVVVDADGRRVPHRYPGSPSVAPYDYGPWGVVPPRLP